eukprot:gb/GEZN01008139.1/.p1 GENE.gb/GEZN01008139.1/~~gb/GEZN01008139.1/.p1  ORF type:complete len:420 (-),score=46.35 gb/GEZN01008139.1/:79-1338(-)
MTDVRSEKTVPRRLRPLLIERLKERGSLERGKPVSRLYYTSSMVSRPTSCSSYSLSRSFHPLTFCFVSSSLSLGVPFFSPFSRSFASSSGQFSSPAFSCPPFPSLLSYALRHSTSSSHFFALASSHAISVPTTTAVAKSPSTSLHPSTDYSDKRAYTGSVAKIEAESNHSTSQTHAEMARATELELELEARDERLRMEVRAATLSGWPRPHMMVDEIQGQLLQFLCRAIRAKHVLELGTFTGYSALHLASALPLDGSLLCCELDSRCAQQAERYLRRHSRFSAGEAIGLEVFTGEARELLAELTSRRPPGPKTRPSSFDFIFVDANKQKYREYYDIILEQGLLREGGLLAFDNTLFKGRPVQIEMDKLQPNSSPLAHSKYNDKVSLSVAAFNRYVVEDNRRTVALLLPLWDGLTLVRKR